MIYSLRNLTKFSVNKSQNGFIQYFIIYCTIKCLLFDHIYAHKVVNSTPISSRDTVYANAKRSLTTCEEKLLILMQ